MLPNKYAKLTAGILVTGALATWGLLGFPGGALADPPPHNHGGGGGGGGSGGGGEPTGTVYFTTGGVFQGPLYTMNADGSNKNPVPNGILGEPSRALHGGQRWFLELHFIAGQFYPDGGQRREVFAVSESGVVVQLSDQAVLEPVPSVTFGATRWTPDDVFVSWVGLRWDPISGMPVDAGVYVAEVDYDGSGNVIGLAAQPLDPMVPTAFVTDPSEVWRPVVRTHDWSPDQTAIVYDTVDWELFTADGATGQSSLLLSTSRGGAGWPVWSPDGSKIAFQYGRGSTATVNPDGSGEKTVFRGADIPQWSPDGGHLITAVFGSLVQDERSDVYRTTAKGGAKVNLTADLDTRFLSGTPTSPVAWR